MVTPIEGMYFLQVLPSVLSVVGRPRPTWARPCFRWLRPWSRRKCGRFSRGFNRGFFGPIAAVSAAAFLLHLLRVGLGEGSRGRGGGDVSAFNLCGFDSACRPARRGRRGARRLVAADGGDLGGLGVGASFGLGASPGLSGILCFGLSLGAGALPACLASA